MADFKLRTEDFSDDDILGAFVETTADREIVELIKSTTPTIIEGSRGTGKSFLLRVAQAELENNLQDEGVLAVYISFTASSLITTADDFQFRHWMLAKILRQLHKVLRKKGLSLDKHAAFLLGTGGTTELSKYEGKLSDLIEGYETSYRQPGMVIDPSSLPDVSDVKDAIEEICTSSGLTRVCLLFDEAAHVFRPAQQRQFFTLFRDLRSAYISCNAAVYPGVTYYGGSFEMTHDATFRRVDRDISDSSYLPTMREMAFSQLDFRDKKMWQDQGAYFDALALSAGGNPRILFKTVSRCSKPSTSDVEAVIKSFYRSEIMAEHTALGEKFKGYAPIIDWGRKFLENFVLPTLDQKNGARLEDKNESSIYFWVHKDAPQPIKEALRLLAYTGIIRKIDDGVRATRNGIGTRYEVKYGCMVARNATPLAYSPILYKHLQIKRFIEFGANHSAYTSLNVADVYENDAVVVAEIEEQLHKSIDITDLSPTLKSKLHSAGYNTIQSVLGAPEPELIDKMKYVGEVRARLIKNAALAEILEYLSG